MPAGKEVILLKPEMKSHLTACKYVSRRFTFCLLFSEKEKSLHINISLNSFHRNAIPYFIETMRYTGQT